MKNEKIKINEKFMTFDITRFIVLLGYGMTELCCLSHYTDPDIKIKPGSVGVLLPNLECKVGKKN